MNNSTLTIRTVGFKRLCRGYFRVLFSGFYSQKGVSLSPSWVDFSPFWVLVDLFTGLVVPTTCSLITCLTICNGRGEYSEILAGSRGEYSWKTYPNHRNLWT